MSKNSETITPEGVQQLLDQALNNNDVGLDELLPGISFVAILIPRDAGGGREQIIFESNRAMATLTNQGALACQTSGTDGRSYVAEVDRPSLYLNQLVLLTCIVGVGDSNSYVELGLNGVSVHRTSVPYKLALPDSFSLSIGAGLNGRNGSRLDIYEQTLFGSTLNKSTFIQLLSAWASNPRNSYLIFEEEDYMVIDSSGNLQTVPGREPLLQFLQD